MKVLNYFWSHKRNHHRDVTHIQTYVYIDSGTTSKNRKPKCTLLRPSNKGNKSLFQVIKAIINQYLVIALWWIETRLVMSAHLIASLSWCLSGSGIGNVPHAQNLYMRRCIGTHMYRYINLCLCIHIYAYVCMYICIYGPRHSCRYLELAVVLQCVRD